MTHDLNKGVVHTEAHTNALALFRDIIFGKLTLSGIVGSRRSYFLTLMLAGCVVFPGSAKRSFPSNINWCIPSKRTKMVR